MTTPTENEPFGRVHVEGMPLDTPSQVSVTWLLLLKLVPETVSVSPGAPLVELALRLGGGGAAVATFPATLGSSASATSGRVRQLQFLMRRVRFLLRSTSLLLSLPNRWLEAAERSASRRRTIPISAARPPYLHQEA
jgi:hypothetical protein